MIFDTFMFCHELDLLEVRLRILYDYVDRFVLQESAYTHSGKPKPFYFQENRDRFAWAEDKIIRAASYDLPEAKDDFTVENHQRQQLYDFVKTLGNDDDIMLISDMDEIPSREILSGIADLKLPIIFEQDLYYYNIKTPLNKKWLGTQALRFGDDTDDLMRKNRSKKSGTAGGWHFSYFMMPEEIIQKVQSFAHATAYGKTPWTNMDRLKQHMKDKTSFLEKPHGKEKPLPLPDYVLEAMKPFPHFLGIV